MKWLTAVFILLLLMLAAIPAGIDAANGWMARRHASVQAIDYLARDIDDLSASRRRAPRKADPAPSDKNPDDQGVDDPLP
jgi:hypothetical protein